MAKLTLVALTFAAIILAIFTEVSAYRTTITTTTITDNPFWDPTSEDEPQCQRQIPIEQVDSCQKHLTQGIIDQRPPQQLRQQCCRQLNSVERECQCNAIQTAYDNARVQGDVIQMRQMLSKAYKLINECVLQVQDCAIASPRV